MDSISAQQHVNGRHYWACQLRCQLVLSAITSIRSQIPGKLLTTCIKHGVLPPRQVLHWLEYQSDLYRAQALADIAPHLPETLIGEALHIARSCADGGFRALALAALASGICPMPSAPTCSTKPEGHEDRVEIGADSRVFVSSRTEGLHGRSRVGGSAPSLCQRARCYQSRPWDLRCRGTAHRTRRAPTGPASLRRQRSARRVWPSRSRDPRPGGCAPHPRRPRDVDRVERRPEHLSCSRNACRRSGSARPSSFLAFFQDSLRRCRAARIVSRQHANPKRSRGQPTRRRKVQRGAGSAPTRGGVGGCALSGADRPRRVRLGGAGKKGTTAAGAAERERVRTLGIVGVHPTQHVWLAGLCAWRSGAG